jgi:hypothetical protein
VTAARSARLSQPWQRHSEAGAAARAEAVVAPRGPPGLTGAITAGRRVAGSRFRSSTVTFVRRHGPYQRLARSGSPSCCSARAERSSHRCRDKRCSVSSGGEAAGPVDWRIVRVYGSHTSGTWMLPRSAVSHGTSANVARGTEPASRCSSPARPFRQRPAVCRSGATDRRASIAVGNSGSAAPCDQAATRTTWDRLEIVCSGR